MNDEEKNRNQGGDDRLSKKIGAREERKIKARKDKKIKSTWFGLGMFGLVGWSVAIPTLVFTAIGLWLDARYESGISWTLTFMFIGVVLGSLNAWYWVKKESRDE